MVSSSSGTRPNATTAVRMSSANCTVADHESCLGGSEDVLVGGAWLDGDCGGGLSHGWCGLECRVA